ncbi:deoxyribose-phosphate aldolase [Halobaculum sp. CBA1158]|uniref:deoxyribose-phosphate aldolase n=1 Tax=Halobaculum sp. CBA1158 TaxID=2904243 RepID=UPI001F4795A5|nr:deoxyribose-phosphate aldolase [Halobaculum sp. CBA1158]UIP00861.1 deoxyribose-phosphate aldolase [Halobaculum sp. CBA1158]
MTDDPDGDARDAPEARDDRDARDAPTPREIADPESLSAAEFAATIDHTVLGPETTFADVKRVLDEAADLGMNACIPPCYVAEAVEYAPDVTTATVIGFPHGQHAPSAKHAEAEDAWREGADELDLVINVGRLKAGETDAVCEEIAEVVAAVPVPVKVIIETALLSEEQKHAACAAARDADAAMVKTSTGFAEGGATVADVELMSEYLPVKASGGVGSYDEAIAMLSAGAVRIGASSGVAIVEGHPEV